MPAPHDSCRANQYFMPSTGTGGTSVSAPIANVGVATFPDSDVESRLRASSWVAGSPRDGARGTEGGVPADLRWRGLGAGRLHKRVRRCPERPRGRRRGPGPGVERVARGQRPHGHLLHPARMVDPDADHCCLVDARCGAAGLDRHGGRRVARRGRRLPRHRRADRAHGARAPARRAHLPYPRVGRSGDACRRTAPALSRSDNRASEEPARGRAGRGRLAHRPAAPAALGGAVCLPHRRGRR